MINGNEYAWEDVQVILPGSVIPRDGVVSIDYEYEKDHTNIKGRGAKAVAMGRGSETPSANMTVLQSLFEEMQAGLPPGKNPTHIAPFTITVAYAPEGGVATVDQLVFVRIRKFKKGMKTGDGNMTIEMELLPGDINYNV